MSDQVIVARSPITVRAVPAVDGGAGTAELTIADESVLAKTHIRAPVGGRVAYHIAVPLWQAHRATDGALVIAAGPGEWLVLGGAGQPADPLAWWQAVLTEAGGGEFVTVLDLTHGRALIRLRGRKSAAMLAKVCAIDLAEEVTPNLTALRTSVARLVTDVVRDDVDGELSYLLHCERSSGQYLFDALLDAGHEFGIETTGFRDTAEGDRA